MYLKFIKLLFILLLSTNTALATSEVTHQETETGEPTKDHTNNSAYYPEDLIQGNKNASVIVIEYFSLTCPHCAYFHKTIYPALKAKYMDTGKIAYIQREFIGNKQDFDSAVLARCGGDMKRLKFYDVLLSQQESWAFNRNFAEILTNIGQLGGISPEQYKTCIEDKTLGNVLMSNTKLIARTPGFIGTPAFVINNQLFPGRFSLEELSAAIEALLNH